jgi:hypothetical protein
MKKYSIHFYYYMTILSSCSHKKIAEVTKHLSFGKGRMFISWQTVLTMVTNQRLKLWQK